MKIENPISGLPENKQQLTEAEKKIKAAMQGVAEQLIDFSLSIKAGDKLLIQMTDSGAELTEMVSQLALAKGAEVRIEFGDSKNIPNHVKTMLAKMDKVLTSYSNAKLSERTERRLAKWQDNSRRPTIDLDEEAYRISPSLRRSYQPANEGGYRPTLKDRAVGAIHHGSLDEQLDNMIWANRVLVIREDRDALPTSLDKA